MRGQALRRFLAVASLIALWCALGATGAGADVDVLAAATTVTPSTGLVDAQSVTVAGSGFTPDQTYTLRLCMAGATSSTNDCGFFVETFATADGTGAFSSPFTVRRTILTSHSPAFDCTASPGACEVAVTDQSPLGPVLAASPISFDPSDPGPPLPTVVATPDTDLVNGQSVAVHATGFAPGAQVGVFECQIDPVDFLHCGNGGTQTADGSGAVDVDFVVRRVLASSGGPGPDFDCATAPGSCAIYAQVFGDPVLTNFAPISFDASVPPPTAGFSAGPLDDLVDGQTVTLTGHIVDTGNVWGYGVCRAVPGGDPALDPSNCDSSLSGLLSIDAAGDVHQDVVVHAVLHTTSGEVDCQAAPGTCVIVAGHVAAVTGPVTDASFPLSFRSSTVPVDVSLPGRQLAFTGRASGRLAAAGVAAVVLGLLLVWIGRPRRRTST